MAVAADRANAYTCTCGSTWLGNHVIFECCIISCVMMLTYFALLPSLIIIFLALLSADGRHYQVDRHDLLPLDEALRCVVRLAEWNLYLDADVL
jgi:hypothetical protein